MKINYGKKKKNLECMRDKIFIDTQVAQPNPT